MGFDFPLTPHLPMIQLNRFNRLGVYPGQTGCQSITLGLLFLLVWLWISGRSVVKNDFRDTFV